MNGRFAGLTLIAALATAASGGAMAPDRQDEINRARDGNIAIQQELDAARRAGTLEAYDLFIARHPQHPLIATARSEREQIVRRRPR